MPAYYNEFDPKAAAWLRELITNGLIADGEVDERSIADVDAADLRGFTQCHFFAGIGGWSFALRIAGWPDDRPVWTGSCPCQPFSVAGKGKGTADERHLWPEFARLIGECRPATVFGEQVASKAGRDWLATVRAEMEDLGYAVGAADLCAAGVGAPHIRQRLWFGAERVADAEHAKRRTLNLNRENGCDGPDTGRQEAHRVSGACGEVRRMANADGSGQPGARRGGKAQGFGTAERGVSGRVADASGNNAPEVSKSDDTVSGQRSKVRRREQQPARDGADCGDGFRDHCSGGGGVRDHGRLASLEWARPDHIDWRDADWLFCRDGKWRPVEPGTQPLAYGLSGRVGLLRGYGNAIVPEVAAEFIGAFEEAISDGDG